MEKIEGYNILQLKPLTFSSSVSLSGSCELHSPVDIKLLSNIWYLNKISEENAVVQVNNLTIALITASVGIFENGVQAFVKIKQSYLHRI